MARLRRARRERSRQQQKLVRELERLAALEPGGAADRPIEVDTPAVVDLRAVAIPCPLCGGRLRLEDHAASEIDGVRLRVATVSCTGCYERRRRYFKLSLPALH